MDEESIHLDISCYSENTNDCIGCGEDLPAKHFTLDELDKSDYELLLEESFWELLSTFEESAQKAFDNGKISGTDKDELFKVFGHFRFSSTLDNEPINIDLGIDPDEFMYSRLVEYLEINEK